MWGAIRHGVGRGERIRTSDLSVPNRAHYQAVLRPVLPLTNVLKRADILAAAQCTGQGMQIIKRSLQGAGSVTNAILN
jgi:hypothetical protein